MRTPSVAVIIVSYNGLPIVKACLPSVVQTKWDNLQIIFVDNHSSDGSVDWVKDQFPEVQVLSLPDNWLYSRANNEAIRDTNCEYVVLLNNDVAVPADWLHPLIECAEKSLKIAAIQPKILQFDRMDHFEYAGACGGYLDRLGYPFARGRIFESIEKDFGQYDQPANIDWASGASLLLRRSAVEEVGFLDDTFGLHMEEIDLCWRLRQAGYEVRVVPQSKVYHIGAATLSRQSYSKLFLNIRNNILTLYKNLPPAQFRRILFQRVILDYFIGLGWLLSGKWKKAAAVFRGYWSAHQIRSLYSPPISTNALPLYRGRILIDYLLMRRRHFSDLPMKKFRDFSSD